MADDKLKTGPEPPGPDRPGDAPAKEAPPIQEPPVQETDAPGKTQEPAAPGTGPALQAEQSVIPGMGEDNPARSALGEVVVDFDKINELTSSVADLINLAQNLDCYEFYPGVEDDETLGRIYVEDMEAIDIPDHLLPYFDYEAYGRDVRINEDGHFAPGGYVLNNGGKFIEHYHGIEDIPAEHKVFAFPQLSVREQMAAYKEIIDGSSLEGYRKIAKKEHEER